MKCYFQFNLENQEAKSYLSGIQEKWIIWNPELQTRSFWGSGGMQNPIFVVDVVVVFNIFYFDG